LNSEITEAIRTIIREELNLHPQETIYKGKRVCLMTEKETCAWLGKSWKWVRKNFRTYENKNTKSQPRFYNKYDILATLEELGLLQLAA